jgi:hypothetical protein
MSGLITASDLANIKASGVYTRIVDNTKKPLILPQGVVRLVAGFSKVGNFNRPILFEAGDTSGILNIFGNRDRTLERKGSFFHETLLSTVGSGAVLALNLLKTVDTVDNNGNPLPTSDTAEYVSMSLSPINENGTVTKKLYSSYFNKERFWIPTDEHLLATRKILDDGKLLSFANLSQKQVSIIVKKANIAGFDVSVKEWYGNTDIPFYLKDTDLISDYFVDVYILAGDYSDYNTLSSDPILGRFFDKRGIIKSTFNEFLALNDVTIVRYFQGSVIPDFVDKDGTIKSIDKIINGGVDFHNILCSIDRNELDKFEYGTNTYGLDLVGHKFIDSTEQSTNFMSYKRDLDKNFLYNLKNTNSYTGVANVSGLTITSNVGSFTVSINNTHPTFNDVHTNLKNGDIVKGLTTAAGLNAGVVYTNPVLYVSNVAKTSTTVTFILTNDIKSQETSASGSFIGVDVLTAVSETLATGDLSVTAVGVGDTITISVNTINGLLDLAEYTVGALDGTTDVEDAINSQINGGTGNHGFSSSIIGTPAVEISAPVGTGALGSDYTIIIGVTGTTTAIVNNQFSGGVTEVEAGMQVDYENDDFYIESTYYIAQKNSDIYVDYLAGKLVTGDIIKTVGGDRYMKFEVIRDADIFDEELKITLYSDADLTLPISAITGGSTLNSDGYAITGTYQLNTISSLSDISKKLPVSIVNTKTVRIDISLTEFAKVGQYLVGRDANNNKYLTRIVSVKNIGTPTPTEIEVETDGVIDVTTSLNGDKQVTRFIKLDDMFDRFNVYSLTGLVIKDVHMPNGTNSRVRDIYSVMTETSIANALTDPDMISFRYFVDTFNNGLEPQSKNYLTTLIKNRRKSMAIINCPTTKEFSSSSNPSFKDEPTITNPLPPLQAKYIANGGNTTMNPDFLYSRPEEEQGASYSMFFYPNIVKRESDGSFTSLPPAGLVSNNFVTKWRDGNGFKATAGQNRGVVVGDGLVGLDHILSKTDRGELETKGINPLRQKNDTILIYGNQTAYHKFRSILNQANSRDTLITIETDTEDILDAFVFDNAFSDDTIRTTIITSLENYYEGLRDTFGAIQSFELNFSRENNPDWVVEDGSSIIDVEIFLPRVTRKFISRITLSGAAATVGSFAAV